MFTLSNKQNKIVGIGLLIFLVLVVFFALWRQQSLLCKRIEVVLENQTEDNLIDPDDIKNTLSRNRTYNPRGKYFKDLNFKKLEYFILENKLIESCAIHQDLSGSLVISVIQHRPIARVLSGNSTNDHYLTDKGKIIPMSATGTERVLVVSGKFFEGKDSLDSKKSADLLVFIKKINTETFWKAQIAEMTITDKGGIVLFPTLGNFQIDFGIATDIDSKLQKIKILYKNILPTLPENVYKQVSVRYKNQIVCE
jgi:cell division protein FtsQ